MAAPRDTQSTRSISGAEMADTGWVDFIAGLIGAWDGRFDSYPAGGGAEFVCAVAGFCVRDMRKYPFWARYSETLETVRSTAQKDTAR